MANDSRDLYWDALCGNESIYDAFWSYALTLNTTNPQLTLCFQMTILTWIPNFFLLLALLPYVVYISDRRIVHRMGSISKLNLAKMIVTSLILLWQSIALIYTLNKEDEVMLASVTGLIIGIIGVLTAMVLTYWIFRRGQHTSGVLLIYWVLTLLCATLSLVSNTERFPSATNVMKGLEFPYYAFVCLIVLLTVPSDEMAKRPHGGLGAMTDEETKPLLGGDALLSRRASEYTRKLPCPKEDASFLSILFYGWFFPIVGTGYKRTLVYEDIWDLREVDSSYVNVNGFMDDWERQLIKNGYPIDVDGHPRVDGKIRGDPSIWKVMINNWGWMYAGAGLIQLTESSLELVNPQIMNVLIDFVGGEDQYMWHGYILAVSMFLTSMIGVLLLHQAFDIGYNVGLRVRTAVIGAIYRKAMKLAAYSGGATSAGAITNLMSVDAQKMQDLFPFLHYMWISPIIISAGTYLLWQQVGVASLAGIAFYAFIIPAVAIVSSKFIRSMQVAQMHLKDARLKLMNQILNGIKVLKLYAWEEYFEKRIKDIRNEEIDLLKYSGLLSISTMTISSSAAFLASLLTFVTYLFTTGNGILSPDVAFVSLSLLNALSFPIIILPNAIQSLIQGLVSIKRIRDFLLAEEVDPSCITRNYIDEGAITVDDGSFSWGEHERIILKDINVSVKEGSLVAIVGSVGSGKTSFMSSILGEMFLRRGNVNVDGTIAYVSQQAWIQNMTLRDNILFSKPYTRQKYQDILDACALTDDLKILTAGDMTEIGERGINVSGGQKQRISLARAVYQNSDIYLLDDPLSAVDAHVGKHIFDKVIGPHGALRNKTRVFVTNGVNFLPQTDKIIVLKDNGISEMGTFDELLSRKGAFAEFITEYLQEMAENEDDEDLELHDEETKALFRRLSSIVDISLTRPEDRRISEHDRRPSGDGVRRRSSRRRRSTMKALTEDKEEKKKDVLVQEEVAEEGNIRLAVIKKYVDSANMSYAIMAVIGIILTIGGSVGSNVWLSEWSNDSFLPEDDAKDRIPVRLGVYTVLGVASGMGNLCVLAAVVYGTLTASLTMHTDMLNNVLKSPMSFFDTTPLGRLINRFSKDIDTMDVELRLQIQMWLNQMAPVIATIIVIIYSTPIFVAVVIPLLILFAILQRVYVKTARQIKRIDSIKRTPVFNNFSETLNGISSIRAYGQQERFIENADTLLDNNQKVWFAVYSSNRWIGVVAQNLGNLIVFFSAIFCVLSRESMDPGVVGMALTFAMQVGLQIVLVVRTTCELENYIVSVERVSEYIETPQEAPWILPGRRTPEGWPNAGSVEFQEYCTRYRAGLDLVLTGVDCQVKAGEKIGIVGRTGAGKSSMTLALFRIIEAAGGAIMIDDINIASLGLHQIRSKLTIIPQDPVVFSGTLRSNIDPAESYADQEVWTALEQAHLRSFVSTLDEGLDYECGEEGQNLSVGQRQLVCLARALLRRTKILILDEATAAIDLETDDLIQNTIRTAFKDCTVLTIAHRLNTIMDSDRVMVLDKGKVKEFMSPNQLLADETTIFYGMAKDAGLV